ncbi:MAG: hypothetical protein WBA63_12475 [Thermomicrobiales bacterium]
MENDQSSSRLSEERLEILRLVENQTVSAEEATRLLEALDRSDANIRTDRTPPPPPPPYWREADPSATVPLPRQPKARNARIRITEVDSQETRLNLVLPLGLLDTGLKMAKRIAPDRLLDAKEIRESATDGFVGHLLDIVDDNERVEILIEARD